jgi:hypothetical protein
VAILLALAGPASAQVEDYADYVPQQRCSPGAKPGTAALARWLVRRGGGYGPISRRCDEGGVSEHKEGRAFDWTLDATRFKDRSLAQEFLRAALDDRSGNEHALARRMGIMYIIWNDQMYSAGTTSNRTGTAARAARGSGSAPEPGAPGPAVARPRG